MAKSGRLRAAFTLTELLVVMFASSIVMGVMAEIFINTWHTQINQETRTQLQQNSRSSLDVLTSTTRQAVSVVDSLDANNSVYSSNETTLVLKLASLDGDGKTTGQYDYIIFRADPNNPRALQRLINADPSSTRSLQASPVSLTTDLNNLAIKYYDNSGVQLIPGNGPLASARSVEISVTCSRDLNNQTIVSKLTDQSRLRNK